MSDNNEAVRLQHTAHHSLVCLHNKGQQGWSSAWCASSPAVCEKPCRRDQHEPLGGRRAESKLLFRHQHAATFLKRGLQMIFPCVKQGNKEEEQAETTGDLLTPNCNNAIKTFTCFVI